MFVKYLKCLELKVHPPIVFLIALSLIYWLSPNALHVDLPQRLQTIFIFSIFLLAIGLALSAIFVIFKAQTTIHPHKPQESSRLVTWGVYRFSRNPMYLALSLILLAITVYFSNIFGLIITAVFVLYITEFQIKPEEVVLTELFGDEYKEYCSRVRRWV